MNDAWCVGRRILLRALPCLAVTALLTACAGGTVTQKPAGSGAVVTSVEPGPPLETVRPTLRHLEDSLVLDLILGYRQRVQGRADAEVEHRARGALQQLEYMLRHGGVKERGGEARVLTAPDGKRLSLGSAVAEISTVLLYNVPGTTWQPETERAREIQRQRPALSALVEDADWVLTLATALESSLAPEEKRLLRELHEAYAGGASHADVTARAQTLLAKVQDDRLRREIKKLANRSWERNRRSKMDPNPVPAPEKAPALHVPIPAVPTSDALDHAFEAGNNDGDDARDTLTSPERYCALRRAEAAQSFAAARSATNDSTKVRFLRQSLERLDECLNRHPESPEAEKARQNRTRVEQELKR